MAAGVCGGARAGATVGVWGGGGSCRYPAVCDGGSLHTVGVAGSETVCLRSVPAMPAAGAALFAEVTGVAGGGAGVSGPGTVWAGTLSGAGVAGSGTSAGSLVPNEAGVAGGGIRFRVLLIAGVFGAIAPWGPKVQGLRPSASSP